MSTESPQVAALRIRYQNSFPEKSAAIAEFQELLSAGDPTSGATALNKNSETASDYLHKLAGSAGMYEYDDIAALARQGMAQSKQQDMPGLLHSLKQIRSLLEQ